MITLLRLATLRNGNCKSSEDEMAKALQTNGRKDYLFTLHREYKIYNNLLDQIKLCDVEIEKLINNQINNNDHTHHH